MKKKISLILVAILMIALSVGIISAFEQPVDAAGEKRHLVWDPVDLVFYCLGTAKDCIFER